MDLDAGAARNSALSDGFTVSAEQSAPSRAGGFVSEPERPIDERGISCIVCAFNEADRIRNILDVIVGHPALAEVIVVNDGSTDATQALVDSYPTVRAISHTPNRGKTYALTRGVAEARCEHLMLLDADLEIGRAHV